MAASPHKTSAYDLLPSHIAKTIPGNGETSEQPDPIAHLKWFTPDGGWTWYVIEYDADSRIAYGYVKGIEDEFGSFALDEIKEIRGHLNLPVERDLHFSPTPVSKLIGSP